ncbi:MFS transporter, partial [Klebsiella pneumoniae]|nr:MFS transporter [Klebsiella pneumoniae]
SSLGRFILGASAGRTVAAPSGLWSAVALLIIGPLVSLFLKSPSSPGSVSENHAHGDKV